MGYNVIGMRAIKGFTLIELMVVMAIIGVMAAMAMGINVSGNLAKGRDGKRKADLAAIQSALEIYRSDLGAYPAGTGSLSPTYMTVVPKDPKTGQAYPYTPAGTAYSLCADLERVAGADDYCVTNP